MPGDFNFNELDMSNTIRDKLLYVSKNEKNFISKAKKYTEKFTWKNCMTEYLTLYNQIKLDNKNC